jgi:hypothetical protein
MKMAAKKTGKRKTISARTLQLLSFCNSKKLPRAVVMGGVRHEWVGIGWVPVGKPTGREVVVVD